MSKNYCLRDSILRRKPYPRCAISVSKQRWRRSLKGVFQPDKQLSHWKWCIQIYMDPSAPKHGLDANTTYYVSTISASIPEYAYSAQSYHYRSAQYSATSINLVELQRQHQITRFRCNNVKGEYWCSGAVAQRKKRERQAEEWEVDDSVFGIFEDVKECTQLSYRGTENIWCHWHTSVWAKRLNPRFSKPHINTPPFPHTPCSFPSLL